MLKYHWFLLNFVGIMIIFLLMYLKIDSSILDDSLLYIENFVPYALLAMS